LIYAGDDGLTKTFVELNLYHPELNNVPLPNLDDICRYEEDVRQKHPEQFAGAFLSTIHSSIADKELQLTVTGWINMMRELPRKHFAVYEEMFGECKSPYLAFKAWASSAKEVAAEANRLDHQISILEDHSAKGLLPAKARPPKEFTDMLQRASTYQQQHVCSTSNLFTNVWAELVKDVVQTEINIKKARMAEISPPSFLEVVKKEHDLFHAAVKGDTKQATGHLIHMLCKWGIPILMQRRHQHTVLSIKKASAEITKAKHSEDTEVVNLTDASVTNSTGNEQSDQMTRLTDIVLDLKKQFEADNATKNKGPNSHGPKRPSQHQPKGVMKKIPHPQARKPMQQKGRNTFKKGGPRQMEEKQQQKQVRFNLSQNHDKDYWGA
jgi:hypothetical protein